MRFGNRFWMFFCGLILLGTWFLFPHETQMHTEEQKLVGRENNHSSSSHKKTALKSSARPIENAPKGNPSDSTQEPVRNLATNQKVSTAELSGFEKSTTKSDSVDQKRNHSTEIENESISYSLLGNWTCRTNDGVQICSFLNSQGEKSREVMTMVVVSGARDEHDGINKYFDHLKAPMRESRSGEFSKVIEYGEFQKDGVNWVKGTHLGSEVLHYYTHYFATVFQRKAYLVTFTYHKKFKSKYQDSLKSLLSTIKIGKSAGKTEKN